MRLPSPGWTTGPPMCCGCGCPIARVFDVAEMQAACPAVSSDIDITLRWSQELRGWITEMDQLVTIAPNGTLQATTIRGVTMTGDAGEEFKVENGQAIWSSASDKGTTPAKGFYIPAGGVSLANAHLIEKLGAAGPDGVELLPSGKATLSLGRTQTIQGPGGPKTVQLAFYRGVLATPQPVWLDENKRYSELGNGTIDFTKIMPDAKLAGLENYFVEQGDNFAVSPMKSIEVSAQYVRKYLE